MAKNRNRVRLSLLTIDSPNQESTSCSNQSLGRIASCMPILNIIDIDENRWLDSKSGAKQVWLF